MREAMRAGDGDGVICDGHDMALAPSSDSTLARKMTALASSGKQAGRIRASVSGLSWSGSSASEKAGS